MVSRALVQRSHSHSIEKILTCATGKDKERGWAGDAGITREVLWDAILLSGRPRITVSRVLVLGVVIP